MKQIEIKLIIRLYKIKTHKLNAAKSRQQKQWLIINCKTVKTKKAYIQNTLSQKGENAIALKTYYEKVRTVMKKTENKWFN